MATQWFVMTQPDARVHCPECDAWIPVDAARELAECDCGTRYIVTVTDLPAPMA